MKSIIYKILLTSFVIIACVLCVSAGLFGRNNGESLDPEVEVNYIVPSFSPCFSPDENGLADPDGLVNLQDVRYMLDSISPEGSEQEIEGCINKFIDSDDGLNLGTWRMVINALYGSSLDTASGSPLTRAKAADDILSILPKESNNRRVNYYPDLKPTDENIALCKLIQSPEHKKDYYKGIAEDGYLLLDGRLYKLGLDGYFVKNFRDGLLYFDGSGKYTSGDEKLDELLTQTILSQTQAEQTRLEKLRSLFDYIRDNIKYVGHDNQDLENSDSEEAGWGVEIAKSALENMNGNCYYFSCSFAHLARALGYQAFIVPGYVGADVRPHCWCEIENGDEIYYCDPELEWNRKDAHHESTTDIFYKTLFEEYNGAKRWTYSPTNERQTPAKLAEKAKEETIEITEKLVMLGWTDKQIEEYLNTDPDKRPAMEARPDRTLEQQAAQKNAANPW